MLFSSFHHHGLKEAFPNDSSATYGIFCPAEIRQSKPSIVTMRMGRYFTNLFEEQIKRVKLVGGHHSVTFSEKGDGSVTNQ